jgi:hypothetical protein
VGRGEEERKRRAAYPPCVHLAVDHGHAVVVTARNIRDSPRVRQRLDQLELSCSLAVAMAQPAALAVAGTQHLSVLGEHQTEAEPSGDFDRQHLLSEGDLLELCDVADPAAGQASAAGRRVDGSLDVDDLALRQLFRRWAARQEPKQDRLEDE